MIISCRSDHKVEKLLMSMTTTSPGTKMPCLYLHKLITICLPSKSWYTDSMGGDDVHNSGIWISVLKLLNRVGFLLTLIQDTFKNSKYLYTYIAGFAKLYTYFLYKNSQEN